MNFYQINEHLQHATLVLCRIC